MLSYWERASFVHYDHIVVGAGIVGVSTAIELKERYPQQKVLVLERGLLPTGATTRNAGFACMGSVTELLDDLQTRDEAAVVQLFARRKAGLEKLRARFGDAAIGYKADGGYELISDRELYALERLDYLNDLLQPVLGFPAFTPDDAQIAAFGFDTRYTKALIRNNSEGGLHSGLLMQAMLDKTMQLGIAVKTGAEVLHYEDTDTAVDVVLGNPHRDEALVLKTGKLYICTNAFTRALLPDEDVVPGRGQVLVTKPVPGLKLRGVFHFDQGYYYFREIDGRVLFGGGRNLDFEGETTTDIALNERIQADLEHKLRTIILPGSDVAVDQRWSGIMAFGAHKGPIIKACSNRVFGAFRMGGMGVALGSEAAADLVRIASREP